jgi:hypothetical protein
LHDSRIWKCINSSATPPFLHASIGQKWGGAFMRDRDIFIHGIVRFPSDECHVGAQSLHFLWLFDGHISRKTTRHIMTQMANMYTLQSEKGEGLYARQNYLCSNLR